MAKYKFLAIVYLFSVSATAISSLSGLDIQSLYRVPFTSFRWIDISIVAIIGSFFYSLTTRSDVVSKSGLIVSLCFIYLVFETFQLLKSWQLNDKQSQISWFICTLNFFILIDLAFFEIDKGKVIRFLKVLALCGAVALIITNMATFYSFLKGQALIYDYSLRVLLDVEGQKESIYTTVLLSFVYTSSLYFVQHESKLLEKGLFLTAILSIYLSLITSFSRGDLATIVLISIIYVIVFSRKVTQAILKVSALTIMLVVFYLMFGGVLREKGYDPIEKISQTVEFATDVDNPAWDNGRSLSRSYALDAWERNLWTGVGYDVLFHWGLPEAIGTAHNFIITSLFQRGIIGTSIYILILLVLFNNSVRLWLLLGTEESAENDVIKLLIIASFFWLIPFWNQEVIWEKYSLSIQFMYLGLITNIYMQKCTEQELTQQPLKRSRQIPV